MAYNILVVDDEQSIADLIELYLQNENYHIFKYYCGKDALESLQKNHYDLAILDVMMPDLDGFSLLKKIRKHYYFPVIMLTAKSNDLDKINGLTLGADDYLTKPFSVEELLARVRSTLRRAQFLENQKSQREEITFENGDLKIDYPSRTVYFQGKELHLMPIEYNLLCLLAHNVGRVLTHQYILDKVWTNAMESDLSSLRVYMTTLRKKIEKNSTQKYIQTHIGVGYRMVRL